MRPLKGQGRAGIHIVAACWGTPEFLYSIRAFQPLTPTGRLSETEIASNR